MQSSGDFLEALNEEQKKAVTFGGKRLMVLAGAGSGKTKTLVSRLAYFCAQGTPPHSLMAITFTNKAAKQMKERLGQCFEGAHRAFVGTFHHVSLRLLRRYADYINLNPHFQVVTPVDQKRIIKEAIRKLNITLDKDVTEAFILKALSYRHQNKNDAFWLNPQHRVGQVIQYYDEFCQAEQLLDFDHLIIRSTQLFQTPFVRENFVEHLDHICVDEFQDTNYQQILWLEALLGQKTGLTLVGDDDQSIYRFRGSDVTIMQSAQNRFEGLEIIKLEQNYRSTSTIVQAANAVISKNSIRLGKNLWTQRLGEKKIEVFELDDELKEADKVAHKIHQLLNHQVSLSDIAILYRSNRQSRHFEAMARKYQWEYRLSGGLGFFDREEIKDTLCYLQLLINRNSTLALWRIINKPSRKIGPKSLEKISQIALDYDLPIYDALIASQNVFKGKVAGAIEDFIALIEEHRQALSHMPLADVASSLLSKSQLIESYSDQKESRQDNLYEFINSLIDYQNKMFDKSSYDILTNFLADTALVAVENAEMDQAERLTLSTVHAAKGLEWPYVFIVGMQDENFPSIRSRTSEELAEERRLFYVALTRARDQCFLTYPRYQLTGYERRRVKASRYLKDLSSSWYDFHKENYGSSYHNRSF